MIKTILRRTVYALLALMALLALALWALRTFFLSDLSALQPRLEAALSTTLKQPVQLQGFRASWGLTEIELHLDRLTVGPEGAHTLRLAGVDAAISALPLLTLQLSVSRASVSETMLLAARNENGDWTVAGMPMTGQTNPQSADALRTVLNAKTIKIDQFDLQIVDAQRGIAPSGRTQMVWKDLALLRQSVALKDHVLTAHSPLGLPEWDSAMKLNASFNRSLLGDVADPNTWRNGLVRFEVAGLETDRFESWLRGVLQAATVEKSTVQQPVASQWLGKKVALEATLSFDAGEISAMANTEVAKESIFFASSTPQANAPRINLEWKNLTAPQSDVQLSLLGQFDLGAIARAPFPSGNDVWQWWGTQIKAANAKGQLENGLFKLGLERIAPQRWHVTNVLADGQLNQMFIEQVNVGADLTPLSLGNVSAKVHLGYDAKNRKIQQASFSLNSAAAWVDAPQWLYDRLKIDALNGTITLDWESEKTTSKTMQTAPRVSFKSVQFSNADAHIKLDGELQGSVAHLNGQFPMIELASLHRYLPKTSSHTVRDGLQSVVQAGQAVDGRFKLVGDMKRFPFAALAKDKASSESFELNAKVKGGALAFGSTNKSAWLALQQFQGKLSLQDGQALLENASATARGVSITAPLLRISDIQNPVLELTAKAAGSAQSFMTLVQNSPWAAGLQDQTAATALNGIASLEGRWVIPFKHSEDTQFTAVVKLNAAQLPVVVGLPPLSDVVLAAEITEQGIKLNTARAKWLGGNMQVQGAIPFTAGKTASKMTLQGNADLALLAKQLNSNAALAATTQARWLQAVTQAATGHMEYALSASLNAQGWQMTGNVDAQRIALNVPKVYAKAAGVPLPITFGVQQGSTGVWQSQLQSGGQFNASFEHAVDAKTQTLRLLRAALALGDQAVVNMPDAGVNAHIVFPKLDADALGAYLASLPWGSAPVSGKNSASFNLPLSVAIQVQDLKAGNRQFKNVIAGLAYAGQSAPDNSWRTNVYADGINGYLTWSDAQTRANNAGTVTGRLQSLVVPDSDVKNANTLLDIAPSQVPNLDLEVANLTVGGKPLGALTLRARNLGVLNVEAAKRAATTSSGWAIDVLQLKAADSDVSAKGLWRKQGDTAQVALSLEGNTQDLGATLTRLGQANVVKGAAGKLVGDIAWQGTPFALDLPSLSGKLTASLGKGQFLKVDPGAGRMLALFSLQSIPRRLTLDFRDMFSDGFAFDTLTGTAVLSKGVLRTDDFLMQSAAAEVRGAGSVDFNQETQALNFVVRPDFNAGGVSLAYMLVNPPLGLGTLLVQWLLREPLRTQLTVEYDITGPWAKPEVKQLDRKVKLKDSVKAELPTK